MISFKKLAREEESAEMFWCDTDRAKFIPVILWLAHAISRGRQPSSSHLLPGVNLQDWLHNMYTNTRNGCRDYSGEPCSCADYMIDLLFEMGSFDGSREDEERQRIVRAIHLVGKKLLRPRRLPVELRSRHRNNLKRERRYWARRNGHWHYDEVMDYMY